MRIGFDTLIENPFRPSSAINYLKSVLRAVARVAPEHEIVVFVSRANRAHFASAAPNVTLVECWSSNENIAARIVSQQLQYPSLLKRHGVDVMHALNQIPLATSIPTVVKVCTLHHHVSSSEFTEEVADVGTAIANRLRLAYRRRALDWSARRATLVMANSESTRDLIVEHMRVPRERIEVVYEAVDDRFVPGAGIAPSTRPYILYVSNLWFYKNPDGAIRGFAEQRRAFGDDLDLVIVGNDDYHRVPELQRLAAREGVAERVRFLGLVPRDRLVQLYQGARVIFYPSFAETFGKPVVEGMRCGVPVVTSSTSSLPELVGDAAMICDPSSTAELAHGLHVAAFDDRARSRMIAAGLRRAEAFSWEKTALGTIEMCVRASRQARRRS